MEVGKKSFGANFFRGDRYNSCILPPAYQYYKKYWIKYVSLKKTSMLWFYCHDRTDIQTPDTITGFYDDKL